MSDKWDRRFLKLAEHIATWSKDPSTRVGAVIVDKDNRIISTGYNGFAKGVDDHITKYNNREIKLKIILHAENNALLFAQRNLENCTIYTTPFPPCSKCASMIIQSGIKRVVSWNVNKETRDVWERWSEDLALAYAIYRETRVTLQLYENIKKNS